MKTVFGFVGLLVLAACGSVSQSVTQGAPTQEPVIEDANAYGPAVQFSGDAPRNGLCLEQVGDTYVLHALVRNTTATTAHVVLTVNGVRYPTFTVDANATVAIEQNVTRGAWLMTLQLTSDLDDNTAFIRVHIPVSHSC